MVGESLFRLKSLPVSPVTGYEILCVLPVDENVAGNFELLELASLNEAEDCQSGDSSYP